jgi:hypothetical protein
VQNHRVPEWFRDAKFGIWAHWPVQCVPEQGDWYARQMYIQSNLVYDYYVKTYGHPSKFGFRQIDNLWKAERWEPEKLMAVDNYAHRPSLCEFCYEAAPVVVECARTCSIEIHRKRLSQPL